MPVELEVLKMFMLCKIVHVPGLHLYQSGDPDVYCWENNMCLTWKITGPVGQHKFTHLGLTHCGLITPFGDTDLGQHWLR